MVNALPGTLSLVMAYLVGSIPTAYLIVRWRKGIDIRTVGSGNVGATNAGRLLGFRYFLLVFGLDLAKGFVPTWGLPWLAAHVAGGAGVWPQLPVVVALATILGHNYPVFLRFRGGKGVATSLGALLALDPVASLAAAVVFVLVLLVTRYVSVSSVLGGVGFTAVYFARVERPWGADQLAMTLLVLLLLVLLVVRHRKNFGRVAAGTEPKVPLGRRKPSSGEGHS